jgi:hypothetical protein
MCSALESMSRVKKCRPQVSKFKRDLLTIGLLALAVLACFHMLVAHPNDLLVGPQHGGNNDLTAHFLASRGFVVIEAVQRVD